MAIQKGLKLLHLALIGGAFYLWIEILWRGHTHWTMGVVGGLCFIVIGLSNEILPFDIPLYLQAFIATLLVTFIELIAGLVINVWFGLSVWDYSKLPLNILGQICVPYMLLWLPLSLMAIILYRHLRYWLFNEAKPQFKLY
ncbi:putative ABC transporter permease [Bacillus sp. JJ722]|uniref:putative ABC transporter permease n=1 Tax=Bacillus sp. JJ722 TaxID=3122973 RepID=UPI002FFE613F